MSMPLSIDAFAAVPEKPAFARGPYLQSATPTTMHIVWRTEGPVNPVVRFGGALDELETEVAGTNIVIRSSNPVAWTWC